MEKTKSYARTGCCIGMRYMKGLKNEMRKKNERYD